MTETPKCPYCGTELEVTHAFVNSVCAAHKLVYTCFCRECGVYTPKRPTPEEALSAALHRAEPENRLLTVNEATGSEDPVWLETRTRKTLMITDVCIATDYHYAEVYTMGRGIPYLILLDSYGKLWRCWPRKPTPEQMAAEKWEE